MSFKPKYRYLLSLLYFCTLAANSYAQYFDINKNQKKVIIPFKLVRSMIIVKLMINDKGPFNFVMDTGVGLMIITEPTLVDSLAMVCRRTIKLSGFGNGEDCEAYTTTALNIGIPGLTSYNVQAAILKKDRFGLSNYAGMVIHGLLGYEFFNNLVVKVDFSDSTLTVYRSKDKKHYNKGERIPITIEDRKPYLKTNIWLPDGQVKKAKLIIDLGAGHPLSLEHIAGCSQLPKQAIAANLGIGFNGPIDGYLSRISKIELGRYKVKNLISSFPISDSCAAPYFIKRDGNLGVGILKKFIIVFDYANQVIYVKPSPDFKQPFEHDMSGLEYYADGDGYKRVIISRVEPGSAGDIVGLEKDDEIVSINFKPIYNMSLEDIDAIFKSKDNRSLLLGVSHDKKIDNVIITLKRRI